MKNKDDNILDWSFEKRNSLITHYQHSSIQPNNTARGGMVKNGFFINLYIDVHKGEIKRRKLIEFNN